MIGVAVNPTEQDVVAEFFELFKTPWEFHRNDGRYDVLICTREEVPQNTAKLVLLYGVKTVTPDTVAGFVVKMRHGGATLVYKGRHMPIYGDLATFPGSLFAPVTEAGSGESATFSQRSDNRIVFRIGYDLFKEARHVFDVGQPAANAGSATLDLHVALMRDLVVGAGIPVVEIPPVPEGHNFITCLTHDIDHPVLRNHCFDHTMVGLLFRATVGTTVNVCRRRKSLKALCVNWTAALKLPFIYLGMARDFWREFDRYIEIEDGLASTYFVIPTSNYAGRPFGGNGIARRATRYDVTDIRPQLQRVISSGCEVGVHGIDSWVDSTKGCEERERVAKTLSTAVAGVRMHWLFFDENSPVVSERAGFSYDSTVGYNETVGYRAGTLQAYKPLAADNLLELPLHIMDTALFFPDYLNLSEEDAKQKVWNLIRDAAELGGALTINWHDRSIAPERLWDGFYRKLLRELKQRGAWFATAAQAVSWFRKRRSAEVEITRVEEDRLRIKASARSDDKLPRLRVRVHKPQAGKSAKGTPAGSASAFVDIAFEGSVDTEIKL